MRNALPGLARVLISLALCWWFSDPTNLTFLTSPKPRF